MCSRPVAWYSTCGTEGGLGTGVPGSSESGTYGHPYPNAGTNTSALRGARRFPRAPSRGGTRSPRNEFRIDGGRVGGANPIGGSGSPRVGRGRPIEDTGSPIDEVGSWAFDRDRASHVWLAGPA